MGEFQFQRPGTRGMGWGSFWLGFALGSYRLDIYWEPVNGWRHLRFGVKKPRAFWLGPLMVIPQNWRKEATNAD
jgi:hypothetical protein